MVSTEQNKVVLRVERLSTIVERATSVPCVILGGVMVAVVISGVFARYLLQNPMSWTEEVSRFLMNWMALLGASIVTRHRAHLGLLYFVQKFPMSVQRLSKLLMDILIMVFLYLLNGGGIPNGADRQGADRAHHGRHNELHPGCVPLAGLLMMIQLALQMIVDLFHWGTSKSPFEE